MPAKDNQIIWNFSQNFPKGLWKMSLQNLGVSFHKTSETEIPEEVKFQVTKAFLKSLKINTSKILYARYFQSALYLHIRH